MRQLVMQDDFLAGNYLSTELRVPITLLGINACSPIATNAIRNNIWDNFSSESYKTLPSAGTIKIRHPITGQEMDYPLPAGGRGYIRPGLARQPLVDRAVPPEQHRRPVRVEPVGRGADAIVRRTRSSRCCGPRSARRIRCSPARAGPASASSTA